MNITQIVHPIHNAKDVLPETNDDVTVFYSYEEGGTIIGVQGHYSPQHKTWSVTDDCDHWSGENYREIDGKFYKVIAWCKLPEIVVSE